MGDLAAGKHWTDDNCIFFSKIQQKKCIEKVWECASSCWLTRWPLLKTSFKKLHLFSIFCLIIIKQMALTLQTHLTHTYKLAKTASNFANLDVPKLCYVLLKF